MAPRMEVNINREWTRMNAKDEWLGAGHGVALLRLDIIAKVLGGFCHEAAKDYRPGFQPWAGGFNVRALLVRHSFWECRDEGGKAVPDVGVAREASTPPPERTLRSPFSERFNVRANPGLKPWAILFNRFAVRKLARRSRLVYRPLKEKVGLASEARSIDRARAKSETRSD